MTLTESTAMALYLAEKYGPTNLTLGPSDPDYGLFLNWLHRSDATLTFPLTLVLRYTRHEPEERKNPQVVEDYTKWFFSRLRSVETALEDREYLCADRFTLADISIGFSLVFAESLGLADNFKDQYCALSSDVKKAAGIPARIQFIAQVKAIKTDQKTK